MPQLTRKQAFALFLCVEFANKEAEVIPTGKTLSELMSRLGESKNTSPREAGRLLQLLEKLGFFRREGRTRYLKKDNLCTERPSALYVLESLKMGQDSVEGLVNLDDFHKILAKKYPEIYSPEILEFLKNAAIGSKYLILVETRPGFFRRGIRSRNERIYLELIGKACLAT